MRDEINKKRLLTWQQRGVHCAGLYLTRPSRLLAMVGSVTHDLDPVQGDFWGAEWSLLSLPAISCPVCRWTWNCQLFGCGSLGYWHRNTPKEKGCNAWIEKNSRGISAEVRAMPIGFDGVGSRYLGSPNAQKSRKPMMPWAELLNRKKTCPYKSSCFFWLSTPMNQEHDAAVQGVSQLWGFFLEAKAHLLLNAQQIITCILYAAVCSYLRPNHH